MERLPISADDPAPVVSLIASAARIARRLNAGRGGSSVTSRVHALKMKGTGIPCLQLSVVSRSVAAG